MGFDLKKWVRHRIGKDAAKVIDDAADAVDLKGKSAQTLDAALEDLRKTMYGYGAHLGIEERTLNQWNNKFVSEKNKLLEKVF